MQTIISNIGFGFCKSASLRNCNNCAFRLRCVNYAPITYRNLTEPTQEISTFNARQQQVDLEQENLKLKEQIQNLEMQILDLKQSKNTNKKSNKVVVQPEVVSQELQLYENKDIATVQQNTTPLKAKKGLFGTKYVEDTAKS